jgi:arylsulfatase A-like enzyme
VPVIGSDIFATVCEVAGIPLPDDRVIDGASMVPAFSGRPIERAVPMYWRTHISSPDSRVAMREGDWKIVGNVDLTEFLLFNLAEDPEETTDLASSHPDRFREMAERLLRLNASVLGDGPDWWKEEEQR